MGMSCVTLGYLTHTHTTSLLERHCPEGSDVHGPSLGEEAQTAIARAQGTIAGCDHPAARLCAGRGPDIGGQGRPHHAEVQGIGSPGRSGEGHAGQIGRRAIDLLLNRQIGAIDIGFIPVVAIGPAQYFANIAEGKGAQGTGGIDLSVSSGRT